MRSARPFSGMCQSNFLWFSLSSSGFIVTAIFQWNFPEPSALNFYYFRVIALIAFIIFLFHVFLCLLFSSSAWDSIGKADSDMFPLPSVVYALAVLLTFSLFFPLYFLSISYSSLFDTCYNFDFLLPRCRWSLVELIIYLYFCDICCLSVLRYHTSQEIQLKFWQLLFFLSLLPSSFIPSCWVYWWEYFLPIYILFLISTFLFYLVNQLFRYFIIPLTNKKNLLRQI